MLSNPLDKRTRGWYTVSVDTLRGGVLLLLLAVVVGMGFLGYQRWMAKELEREAATLLTEVGELLARAEATRPSGAFGEEFDAARRAYDEALADVEAERFGDAVAKARRGRALLLAILESGPTGAGEAQFIAVSGGVEYRRGERGEWDEARSRVVLQSGDYVKTATNGSAEIVFLDGTLYNVRPNTLLLVTRKQGPLFGGSQQAIRMEYGWVDLSTAQRGGRVETPRAEARVERESEGAVTYDQQLVHWYLRRVPRCDRCRVGRRRYPSHRGVAAGLPARRPALRREASPRGPAGAAPQRQLRADARRGQSRAARLGAGRRRRALRSAGLPQPALRRQSDQCRLARQDRCDARPEGRGHFRMARGGTQPRRPAGTMEHAANVSRAGVARAGRHR